MMGDVSPQEIKADPSSGYICKEGKGIGNCMFIATPFTRVKIWKQLICPVMGKWIVGMQPSWSNSPFCLPGDAGTHPKH
jgi:hypothetical protein